MNSELKKVIESSSFLVLKGEWVYAKVSEIPKGGNYFMVTKDIDEITAVFEESQRDQFKIIEENKDLRKLIELKVSIPFYSVGFLATVTGTIAEQGLNVLVVSTYSKDYILVKTESLQIVKEALLKLGF